MTAVASSHRQQVPTTTWPAAGMYSGAGQAALNHLTAVLAEPVVVVPGALGASNNINHPIPVAHPIALPLTDAGLLQLLGVQHAAVNSAAAADGLQPASPAVYILHAPQPGVLGSMHHAADARRADSVNITAAAPSSIVGQPIDQAVLASLLGSVFPDLGGRTDWGGTPLTPGVVPVHLVQMLPAVTNSVTAVQPVDIPLTKHVHVAAQQDALLSAMSGRLLPSQADATKPASAASDVHIMVDAMHHCHREGPLAVTKEQTTRHLQHTTHLCSATVDQQSKGVSQHQAPTLMVIERTPSAALDDAPSALSQVPTSHHSLAAEAAAAAQATQDAEGAAAAAAHATWMSDDLAGGQPPVDDAAAATSTEQSQLPAPLQPFAAINTDPDPCHQQSAEGKGERDHVVHQMQPPPTATHFIAAHDNRSTPSGDVTQAVAHAAAVAAQQPYNMSQSQSGVPWVNPWLSAMAVHQQLAATPATPQHDVNHDPPALRNSSNRAHVCHANAVKGRHRPIQQSLVDGHGRSATPNHGAQVFNRASSNQIPTAHSRPRNIQTCFSPTMTASTAAGIPSCHSVKPGTWTSLVSPDSNVRSNGLNALSSGRQPSSASLTTPTGIAATHPHWQMMQQMQAPCKRLDFTSPLKGSLRFDAQGVSDLLPTPGRPAAVLHDATAALCQQDVNLMAADDGQVHAHVNHHPHLLYHQQQQQRQQQHLKQAAHQQQYLQQHEQEQEFQRGRMCITRRRERPSKRPAQRPNSVPKRLPAGTKQAATPAPHPPAAKLDHSVQARTPRPPPLQLPYPTSPTVSPRPNCSSPRTPVRSPTLGSPILPGLKTGALYPGKYSFGGSPHLATPKMPIPPASPGVQFPGLFNPFMPDPAGPTSPGFGGKDHQHAVGSGYCSGLPSSPGELDHEGGQHCPQVSAWAARAAELLGGEGTDHNEDMKDTSDDECADQGEGAEHGKVAAGLSTADDVHQRNVDGDAEDDVGIQKVEGAGQLVRKRSKQQTPQEDDTAAPEAGTVVSKQAHDGSCDAPEYDQGGSDALACKEATLHDANDVTDEHDVATATAEQQAQCRKPQQHHRANARSTHVTLRGKRRPGRPTPVNDTADRAAAECNSSSDSSVVDDSSAADDSVDDDDNDWQPTSGRCKSPGSRKRQHAVAALLQMKSNAAPGSCLRSATARGKRPWGAMDNAVSDGDDTQQGYTARRSVRNRIEAPPRRQSVKQNAVQASSIHQGRQQHRRKPSVVRRNNQPTQGTRTAPAGAGSSPPSQDDLQLAQRLDKRLQEITHLFPEILLANPQNTANHLGGSAQHEQQGDSCEQDVRRNTLRLRSAGGSSSRSSSKAAARARSNKGGRPPGSGNKQPMVPRVVGANGVLAFASRSVTYTGVYRARKGEDNWRAQFAYGGKVRMWYSAA